MAKEREEDEKLNAIPVSYTHLDVYKRQAVRWGITKSLMTAWILTIPVSGLLAATIYYIVSLFL